MNKKILREIDMTHVVSRNINILSELTTNIYNLTCEHTNLNYIDIQIERFLNENKQLILEYYETKEKN